MRPAEAELRDALAEFGERIVDYHGQRVEFASVLHPGPPLVVELNEGREQLEEDEHLLVPAGLRRVAHASNRQDTVAVTLMGDGRYLLQQVVSEDDSDPEYATKPEVADAIADALPPALASYATDAELASAVSGHAAAAAGVHGVPSSPTVNRGLLWNGSGWTSAPEYQRAATKGAALPSSPYDGQVFYYEPMAGVIWRMRYDESLPDAYKWVFTGGGRREFTGAGGTVTFPGSAFVHTAIPNAPAYNVPYAGYWNVRGNAYLSAPSSVRELRLYAGNPAVTKIGVNELATINSNASPTTLTYETYVGPMTAGEALTLLAMSSVAGGTSAYQFLFLRVWPNRIG